MTVPGMVQKKASGVRWIQLMRMVSRPLAKKTPKIHDDSWPGERSPWPPAVRMTATGPVAEKISAMRALANSRGPMSESTRRGEGRVVPAVAGVSVVGGPAVTVLPGGRGRF